MKVVKHLQSYGIRPSLHRTEVMRFLDENSIHPSVDTIYEALSPRIPTLSRTTIYNILNLFVEKAVVREITIDPHQCRYDSNVTEHAHFLCSNCGGLYDVHIMPIVLHTPHKVNESQLYVKGICENCLTKN